MERCVHQRPNLRTLPYLPRALEYPNARLRNPSFSSVFSHSRPHSRILFLIFSLSSKFSYSFLPILVVPFRILAIFLCLCRTIENVIPFFSSDGTSIVFLYSYVTFKLKLVIHFVDEKVGNRRAK